MTSKEFINKTVKQISDEGIKVFPDDFLPACETVQFKLPSQTLVMGNEFFGSREVLTPDGSLFCQTESLAKAKYLIYASGRKNREIKIPVDDEEIETAVKNYGIFLDSVLQKTEKEYKSLFPESKDVNSVVSEVFRLLNLKRL